MTFREQKGFTLVELLVVISIISMLASVVVASIGSAREKARIAAIVQFATNLYHTNGDKLILHYNFDEGAMAVKDMSQNNNDAKFVNLPTFSDSYIQGAKQAAIFQNQTDLITDKAFKLPSATTITVWIKTNSTRDYLTLFSNKEFNPGVEKELQFGIHLSRIFENDSGVTKESSTDSPIDLRDGKWHHLVWTTNGLVSVDPSFSDRFYIDGRPMGVHARGSVRSDIETMYNVGFTLWPNQYFEGTMDDFMIYGQALAAKDVRALYAQGLKTHLNN